MIILSLLLSTLTASTMGQISEQILILGDFNAGSLITDQSPLNLTSSTSQHIYQLNHDDNDVTPLRSIPKSLSSSIPTIWEETSHNSSVLLIDGEPYSLESDNQLSLLKGWSSVNGSVSTVYFDGDDNLLYLGGDLSYNGSHGAVIYNYEEEAFHTLAFGGFNEGAQVNTINKYFDSIIFGGTFNDIGESQYLNITNDNSNSTHTNKTSSNVRDVSQMIPIDRDQVSATAGENAQAITCPDSANPVTWTLPDGQLGTWQASLRSVSTPAKLRLYNPQSDNEGVSLFRVVTSPANGIMNLTYIDPETLELKHCDAYCPLLQTSDLSSKLSTATNGDSNYETFFHDNRTVISVTDFYQDFAFVNLLDVESFQVQVMKYYGSNAALDGVELFRSGITVFAQDSLNDQSCSNADPNSFQLDVYSEPIGSTEWTNSTTGSYLYTTVPSSFSANSDIGIKYYIDIPISGQYDVLLYTVGCAGDNTCSQRGAVKATLFQGNGTELSSMSIYQTNEQEKYDVIYSGDISYSASNSAYIELTFESSLTDGETVIVASSAQFNYLQLDVKQYFNILKNNTALELNNIFEYSLNNFSLYGPLVDEPIGKTDINMIGSDFTGSSSISDISVNDTTIIISGGFKTENSQNILGYQINGYNLDDNFISLGDSISIGQISKAITGGFGSPEDLALFGSGPINSLRKRDSGDVILFQGTNSSLSTVNVENNSTITNIDGFIFNETEYLIIGEKDSASVFDVNSNSLFQKSNLLNMNLISSLKTNDTDADFSVVMGNIVKFDLESNNIMSFKDGSLNSIQNSINDVNAAVYINNTMVAIGSESNVYSLSNNKTNVLVKDLSIDDGSINQMMYYNNSLYLAFNGSASYKNESVNGVSVFDLKNNSLKPFNSSITGVINSMVIDPEFGSFIIGGKFDISGKCTDLCTLDTDLDSVFVSRTLNSSISGEINCLNYFADYGVLVGGDFSSNEESGYLGVYNTSTGNVDISSLSKDVPGPVSQFIFANETQNEKSLDDQIIVLGTDYIGYLNDSKWNSLSDGLNLDKSSQLNGISLVDVESDDRSFYDGKVLLLTGYFNVTDQGYVSNAYYNGESWIPFSVNANDLEISNAEVKSVMKYTSMFVLSGSFTSTSSHTSTSTRSPKETGSNNRKDVNLFSSGQVVGVSLALAIGTTLVLGGLAWLLFAFTGSKKDSLEGLDEKEEKMMEAVPPNKII